MTQKKYNLNAIRDMILHVFNDDQLNAFCLDHFYSAYRHITVGMSKKEKVATLIDHAERDNKIPDLLEKVKEKNEFQFMNYESRIYE